MRGNTLTDRNGSKNQNYKHGLRGTRLYRIFANMKSRCYNPNFTHYSRYGARGITICSAWLNDFQSFYNWAISNGYADDLSIDRIDNDKGYSPDNCRWESKKAQSVNRSTNNLVTLCGTTKTLIEWCATYEINYKTVRDRLKRGWPIERALMEPVRRGDSHSFL